VKRESEYDSEERRRETEGREEDNRGEEGGANWVFVVLYI
jgi:hypothetical protein